MLDNGITDGLLGRKGIHRKHRVRVTVFDNGQVRGKGQAFNALPVNHNAAGFPDDLRHSQDVVAKLAVDGGPCRSTGRGFPRLFHFFHLLHDFFVHVGSLRFGMDFLGSQPNAGYFIVT